MQEHSEPEHLTPRQLSPLHRKRVLLVDDQRSFQVMMKAMLQNLGFSQVTILATAEEARRRCAREMFDIYLLDYNLGSGQNGRQLLEFLRQQQLMPAESTVFIISGDNSRAMVLSALESEPDGYMMKPFSQEQLRVRLLRAMHRKAELAPVYAALQEMRHRDVIEACRSLIDEGSRYTTFCRCMMAEMYIHLDELIEARALLRSGLAEAESAWLRLGLGKVCYRLGEFEDAIAHLNSALRLRPLMVEAYRWLSQALVATGAHQEAVDTLSRATEISPQSAVLQRHLAEVALQQGDYLHARDAISTMLDLHRYDAGRTAQLLGSYVHTLILYALHSDDPYHLSKLQRQVNNALYRCRGLLGDCEFDLRTFEQICQARVQIAHGEMNRAKRMLYKALQTCQQNIDGPAPSLASNLLLGFTQLGEYEYVVQLQDQLGALLDQDPLLKVCVQTMQTDSTLLERQQRYNELNDQGIAAYRNGHYLEAVGFFREALHKAPANTNAALNKAQCLMLLHQSKAKDKDKDKNSNELLDECRDTLSLLDGVQLSPAQAERLYKLQDDLQAQR